MLSRPARITAWVLQALGAAAFLGAGIPKLMGAAPMVQLFDTIGIGQWFRYVTGGIEVGSALLFFGWARRRVRGDITGDRFARRPSGGNLVDETTRPFLAMPDLRDVCF